MKKETSCLFLLALLVFGFSQSAAAQSISGKLIDKETGKAIPYANIQIGEHFAAITNTEGEFILNIENVPPSDSLVFSSIGFERKAIAIKDYPGDTIYLNPKVTQLPAIYVTNERPSARQVMDSVKKYLVFNYVIGPTEYTIFKRSKNTATPKKLGFEVKKARNMIDKKILKKFNRVVDSMTRVNRGNTLTTYAAFLARGAFNNKDSLKLRLKKATTLTNQKKDVSASAFTTKILEELGKYLKTGNTFKVRSGIIPIADSVDLSSDDAFSFMEDDPKATDSLKTIDARDYTQRILSEVAHRFQDNGFSMGIGSTVNSGIESSFLHELDDYEYKIKNIISFNDEFVYVIGFKPDRNIFGNKGRYTGILYVSTDSYAVVKENYRLAEGEHGSKLNLKFLLGFKYVERAKSGTVIYRQNKAGKYMPKYVQMSGKRYVYFSRKFVFNENGKGRRDRIKLKFGITIALDNAYQEEWVFTNPKPITSSDFSDFDENKGVIDQKLEHYNPKIWGGSNSLAPTEAIREYNR